MDSSKYLGADLAIGWNKHRTPLEVFEPFLMQLFQRFQSHQDFQNMV